MPSQRKTVFFEEVSLECTATEIFEAFKRFGVILEIQLRTNGKTIANSGSAYGFVRFTDLNSAHHAKKEMEGITFFGRKLKLGWVTESYKTKVATVQDMKTAQVHVSWVSRQTVVPITEHLLRGMFSAHGHVLEVVIKKSEVKPGLEAAEVQSGYGFVHYPADNDGIQAAINAASAFHQTTTDGITLDCSLTHKLSSAIKATEEAEKRCYDSFHPSLQMQQQNAASADNSDGSRHGSSSNKNNNQQQNNNNNQQHRQQNQNQIQNQQQQIPQQMQYQQYQQAPQAVFQQQAMQMPPPQPQPAPQYHHRQGSQDSFVSPQQHPQMPLPQMPLPQLQMYLPGSSAYDYQAYPPPLDERLSAGSAPSLSSRSSDSIGRTASYQSQQRLTGSGSTSYDRTSYDRQSMPPQMAPYVQNAHLMGSYPGSPAFLYQEMGMGHHAPQQSAPYGQSPQQMYGMPVPHSPQMQAVHAPYLQGSGGTGPATAYGQQYRGGGYEAYSQQQQVQSPRNGHASPAGMMFMNNNTLITSPEMAASAMMAGMRLLSPPTGTAVNHAAPSLMQMPRAPQLQHPAALQQQQQQYMSPQQQHEAAVSSQYAAQTQSQQYAHMSQQQQQQMRQAQPGAPQQPYISHTPSPQHQHQHQAQFGTRGAPHQTPLTAARAPSHRTQFTQGVSRSLRSMDASPATPSGVKTVLPAQSVSPQHVNSKVSQDNSGLREGGEGEEGEVTVVVEEDLHIKQPVDTHASTASGETSSSSSESVAQNATTSGSSSKTATESCASDRTDSSGFTTTTSGSTDSTDL